jgi:nitrogen fixation protein NifU and related proteins
MSADDRSSVPLRALYQEVILDHYRRPRNVGEPEGEHVTVRKRNPTCGDEITLHLSVIDGRIAEGRFQGQGCSISQASASMMTELVRGKSPEEARSLAMRFREMLQGDEAAGRDARLGSSRALSGVARVPARIGCAMLAWVALEEATAS